MTEVETTDVAIVGYGPTGQLLALLLARQGHRVLACDRWPNLYPLPRAVHFDDEIARILQAAGAIDEVNRITEQPRSYEWRNADRKLLLQFDWSAHGLSGWPSANFFSQPDLEKVLDRHVKDEPAVDVWQGWSAAGLIQDDAGVVLDLEQGAMQKGQWVPNGARNRVRARYVIGADGANSFVRRSLGIEMQDLGFAFNWLVVDAVPKTPRVWEPECWQLCDPRRPTTVVPGGPGRRRWEFMLLPGEDLTQMNCSKVAWKLLAPWDMTPENAVLERHAVYTFRGQWAKSWKSGHVLLAGDAAHLTPPFAGQGMCSGMRDSLALAWRLDLILRGVCGEEILESYGSERSSHVQELIWFSVELGKVICISDPQQAKARDIEMTKVCAAPGYQPPPPPKARLGPGLWASDLPDAGFLSPQAQVEFGGRRARFDDVFGGRFALMCRDAATLAAISPHNRAALETVDAALVHFGPGGLTDVDHQYLPWLERLGCGAVLVRPDFYLHGGVRNATELNKMLDDWREALAIRDLTLCAQEAHS
ncbi:bifunctional 3-(3-hydroxy-phenyl)propionate/3-hydroxycinnamic acid hydroxylase MhpA [Xanthobacter sp. ZOL 2024]